MTDDASSTSRLPLSRGRSLLFIARLAEMKKHWPIRIKRVYDPPDSSDGARVLVDGLWPRGLRKEKAALVCWLKEIAPSKGLREWFGHEAERYGEFARRYRAELAGNKEQVARLEDLAKRGPLTLLYAARDEEHNHALVLADYLRKHMERGHGKRPV